ncbi:alpha beta hydrolase fold protein [Fusarium flagelliforme]|uniref:Alpha beta hydrolase fold protein n=1 Tax=Fusarium flagelliforme TaxID=2675880 RepID=A0A395MIR4_9HYPO|nr:alpha beta hydrolase fold protein [Fusarium flagelliforme]
MFNNKKTAILTLGLLGLANVPSVVAAPIAVEELEWPSQYVQSGPTSTRVLVQGHGPAVVILPSYGRDDGDDFNGITSALVDAGYLVLRPQPRGTLGSIGPMVNVTLDDLASDVADVIDTLGGGRAIVFGHAFGTFVTKRVALNYPDKVPAIVVASPGGQKIPKDIAGIPFVTGNISLPVATRLAALEKAFFAPGHDAHIWLNGWYQDTLAMEHGAIETAGDLTKFWAGANSTQVLELIPAEDPFQPKDQWHTTADLYPDRAISVVIQNASHALLPENLNSVVEAVLPYLAEQSTRL